jgi:3-oxoacyl-[acyl-carrier-protein] synthase II
MILREKREHQGQRENSKGSPVVITGLGVLSPVGIGRSAFWSSLIRGKSGIGKVGAFDTVLYRTHKAGEVKNFNPDDFTYKIKVPHYFRGTHFALAAVSLAIKDALLERKFILEKKDRVGVIIGSTTVDPKLAEKYTLFWARNGYAKTPVVSIENCDWFTSGLANSVCREFGICGLSMSTPAACAAGNYAISYAYDLLKAGKLDIVLAGGVDPLNQLVFAGFNRLFISAVDKCRPFDLNRKGLIVSEGAGILVLETLEHARQRKANIYAQILSCGLSSDAYHVTGLHPEGSAVASAMKMALSAAGVGINDIDYINAHGTGTPLNDKIETKAIKKLFGKKAKKIPVSSIKSMLGHTMGAASAIEAIACALAVKEDIIPPTINYQTPDPECDLDYVPNEARRERLDIVLSNSFGFGGNIAALLIGKFND